MGRTVCQLDDPSGSCIRSTNGLHQFCRLHSQRARQGDDVDQADVAFAALNAPNVVAMQIGKFCETLLREAAFDPQLADVPSEGHAWIDGSHLELWSCSDDHELYTL